MPPRSCSTSRTNPSSASSSVRSIVQALHAGTDRRQSASTSSRRSLRRGGDGDHCSGRGQLAARLAAPIPTAAPVTRTRRPLHISVISAPNQPARRTAGPDRHPEARRRTRRESRVATNTVRPHRGHLSNLPRAGEACEHVTRGREPTPPRRNLRMTKNSAMLGHANADQREARPPPAHSEQEGAAIRLDPVEVEVGISEDPVVVDVQASTNWEKSCRYSSMKSSSSPRRPRPARRRDRPPVHVHVVHARSSSPGRVRPSVRCDDRDRRRG